MGLQRRALLGRRFRYSLATVQRLECPRPAILRNNRWLALLLRKLKRYLVRTNHRGRLGAMLAALQLEVKEVLVCCDALLAARRRDQAARQPLVDEEHRHRAEVEAVLQASGGETLCW